MTLASALVASFVKVTSVCRSWLFVWEDDGGERIANILTIVATCVSHGLGR